MPQVSFLLKLRLWVGKGTGLVLSCAGGLEHGELSDV